MLVRGTFKTQNIIFDVSTLDSKTNTKLYLEQRFVFSWVTLVLIHAVSQSRETRYCEDLFSKLKQMRQTWNDNE